MAARAPTDFNQYLNTASLQPNRSVLTTTPSNAVDDQHFALQKLELIYADTFYPISTQSTTSTNFLRGFYSIAPNGLGVYSAVRCRYTYLAWADSADDFYCGFYDQVNTRYDYITVSASHTSKLWRGWASTNNYIDLPADNTNMNPAMFVYTSNAASTVYVAGFAVIAESWVV